MPEHTLDITNRPSLQSMKTTVALIGLSSASAYSSQQRFVGFDLGTSGARISIIESCPSSFSSASSYREIFSNRIPWDGTYDDSDAWLTAVRQLLHSAQMSVNMTSIRSICVSGTSASCLLVDAEGKATRSPRMYDYDVVTSEPKYGSRAKDLLHSYAPPKHTARANTAACSKLLSWMLEEPLHNGERLCHQSDFITMKLSGTTEVKSDWHNTLKLGYDVRQLEWPAWLLSCLNAAGAANPLSVLPSQVVSPGEIIGNIGSQVATEFGLSRDCCLVGGTTDSNAAFFAAVGNKPTMGTAVTSLGSTLAIKQLSKSFVEDSARGVYSHRFPGKGEGWLIGGASNVGCAVLRQENFSNEELVALSTGINPLVESALSYYPLTKKGERFPVADSEKLPILDPKPESRMDYLHGILQGISSVECDGFKALGELGASPSPPTLVLTCGGGSMNENWSKMRQRRLAFEFNCSSIVVQNAENTEASFGAAILAAISFQ